LTMLLVTSAISCSRLISSGVSSGGAWLLVEHERSTIRPNNTHAAR